MRYQPVIAIVNEFGATDVLDVGAGWHGISRWWDGRVVQTDLILEGRPKGLEARGSASYVKATAENLPFADGAFDFTVSLDMFEHLPTEIRTTSVRELVRVSRRGAVIGFPVSGSAESVDLKIAAACRRMRRPIPSWLSEHLAQDFYPDRSMLEDALPPTWHITREVPNGHVSVQRWLVLAELTPVLAAASHLLERALRRVGQLPDLVHRPPAYRTIWLVEPTPPTAHARLP
ncbi:class I SAM-dependent methyltransferase [Terrabacter sp. RAF57]|uniref:class I SAM-dependent methyltransferase n=1 Tax=Terrabacter sp. RAF57 TaxID=3233063 RepID=UPI003F9AB990